MRLRSAYELERAARQVEAIDWVQSLRADELRGTVPGRALRARRG